MKFFDIELYFLDKEKVKVFLIEEENEMDILKELGLLVNVFYYKIKCVCFFEDIFFLVYIIYLLKKLVKELIVKDIFVYLSIYEKVCKDFGIDFFFFVFVEINEIVFLEYVELFNLLNLSF